MIKLFNKMALLSDVYGDNFAKEMKEKNYDYLLKPKPKPPPQPTLEDMKRDKKMSEELRKDFTKTITIGDIVIGGLCYETFPCQHYCNGKLEGARQIYKLLENAGLVNDDSLTQEQKTMIKHLKY